MRKELTGLAFGRWAVLNRAKSIGDHSRWNCECSCGTKRIVYQISLVRGQSRSCGCLHREIVASKHLRHGKFRSAEYSAWASMIQRCQNKNANNYDRYGGRGIRVCKEWVASFEAFFRDMGARPSARHSIDRRNNDGNYEPGNCQWATKSEQANNTSVTILVTHNGERKSLREWSSATGIGIETLRSRHKRGWAADRMLKAEIGVSGDELLAGHEAAA